MIDENFKLEHPGWVAQINAQESANYELMGSDNAKCGNDYDPWNLICVSWRDYGDASKRDMIYARLKAKVKAAQKIGQDAAAALGHGSEPGYSVNDSWFGKFFKEHAGEDLVDF